VDMARQWCIIFTISTVMDEQSLYTRFGNARLMEQDTMGENVNQLSSSLV
jgi:hypothetical protein